jgi:Spy/CpxP family protein refolding chaperone
MTQLPRTITLAALFAALLALPALAGDSHAGAFAGRGHHNGAMRCLRAADMSDTQKTDISALFDAARPGFEADVAAIRAARKTLDNDANAGADKSVLGQDYLNVQAASKKLRDDHAALQAQILAKLTPDQKTKVQSCLDSSGHGTGTRTGAEF